jgi:predicted alpha-1,2-mannosidase
MNNRDYFYISFQATNVSPENKLFIMKSISIPGILISCMLIISSCGSEQDYYSPLEYVDIFIGTATKGHTIVSPTRPFGMVKPAPDTELRRNYLNAKYITGFSQLHFSGGGGNGQSAAVGIMPVTGKLIFNPVEYRSTFDPDKGVAEPGYYSIMLTDYMIHTEITCTERVSLYRFTFPESNESHILVNVSHAFNKYRGGELHIFNDTTVKGTGKYNGYHGSDFDIAFMIQFDRPFDSSGIWSGNEILKGEYYATMDGDESLGAFFSFETHENDTIMMKIGISYVDTEGAGNNIKSELPGWDFEAVRTESRRIWEDLLKIVKVIGGTDNQRTTFYTALYHTMLSPCILSDVDGRYEGFDGKIHEAKDFVYYGEFPLWDSYRTVHPIYVLLQPRRQHDMIQSLLTIAEQGGWLPKWAWSEGYTGGMLGDHAVSLITDSYMKGIRDFDVNKAYSAMRKNAMEKLDGVPWGRRGLKEYISLGFAPEDAGYELSIVANTLEYAPGGAPFSPYYPKISGSVSATLEFAYDDWCVSEMAKVVNKPEDADYFMKRAYNYKNVYDPVVGFMRPRNSDGTWAMNPFISTMTGRHSQFYCEGNAWTYSWLVPHDIQGLINLMGGEDNFITKLDSAFAGLQNRDSYFDPSNEPDIHYPYLYNYAGAPWKTQNVVRTILDTFYSSDRFEGLPGDDDAGTISAWYIFSALGFYPVTPGSQVYVIGSPIFRKVMIFLDGQYYNNMTIEIKTVNNSPENKYIQNANLNGKPLGRPWFTHAELTNNGRLIFTMGKTANKNWGTAKDAAPPSMTKDSPLFVYGNLIVPRQAEADSYVNVQVMITNTGGLGTAYTKLYRFDRNLHYKRGHLVGENKLVLSPGDTSMLNFSVPLYFPGKNMFKMDTLTAIVQVDRPNPIK